MRALLTTTFFAAALALTGCSAGSDHGTDGDETTEGAIDALSTYGKKLVGAWKVKPGDSFELDEIVLKGDGSYFWHHDIYCIKAPCPTDGFGRWIGYAPAKGSVQGRLRLISSATKGDVRQYVVVIGGDGTIKLSRFGNTAILDPIGTYCQAAEQCEGQANTIMIKCAGGYHAEPVCTEKSTCSKTCVKDAPTSKCVAATQGGTTSCKPDVLWKDYASADCASRGLELGTLATREPCGDGVSRYVDYQCCPKAAAAPCVKTGCSGQVCADSSVMTTCEFRPEYACYATATCERNAAGACGWKTTPELTACLSGGSACDYSAPGKRYVGKSLDECSRIRFACLTGEHYFSDACGCGCAAD